MKVHKSWIGSKKPATKGDLADLQEDIHVDLQQFATKQDLNATKQDLKNELEKYATKEDVKEFKDQIIYEFHATAKEIHKNAADTSQEEISWMKDMVKAIARHVGLPIR